MMHPTYSRYLASKRSVDDRSLNWHVQQRLRSELRGISAERLRVVEVGGGLGTMVARLLEQEMLVQADYLLLDVDAELLEAARRWLVGWAKSKKLAVLEEERTLHIRGESGVDVAVTLVQAELADFVADEQRGAPADLVIASGFLDRVDVPAVLPDLFALLVSEGLFCFTLNFDGEIIFQPEHPDDVRFARVHHRSQDEGPGLDRAAGDSRCGRHLFGHLFAAGATVLAAGASDAVVYPQGGGYPGEEADFLGGLLDIVAGELRERPETPSAGLDAWLSQRRQQVARGELVYIAHQLDFVGRRPPVRAT